MPARFKLSISFLIAAANFLFFPRVIFAVTTTISDFPSSISTEPFTITVSISGAAAGTNYLRIDFYKDGTTSYFGETYNGTNWYGGSDGLQYLPITIESGVTWTGSVQGRLGSPSMSNYDGPGSYKLRTRRHTGSGNYNTSEANNSSVTVNIIVPTSSPTPTPTSTPTPTPIPTSTPTPSPSTATYKINEVKDEEGNTLSSVKVYVDGIYVHHYAPETLTFCEGCQCDTYVDCGFGSHTIELQKTGYQDWSENKTINAGNNFEVNPVMEKEEDASSVPTPTSSPTPTPKAVKVVGTTLSGEILGEEEATPEAFYPWEAIAETDVAQEVTPSKRRILPYIFLGLGLTFLAAAAFSLYTKLRWPKLES